MARIEGLTDATERTFLAGSLFYLAAWALHSFDHVRRGLFDIDIPVQVLGNVQVVLTVVFIWMLANRHRLSPTMAIAIGIPATLGIAMAHLLPDFGSFSDSLWNDGIDWFTWTAVIIEISGSTVLTIVGVKAWREQQVVVDRTSASPVSDSRSS
ncbi:MAG: hypothetical protein HKN26_00790 [Acidimicrobiales bacterium]|nr:hypothetical protein [Acidimicrobiales bacterium]